MKKTIITLLLAAMPFVTFAQEVPFSKFEDVEGIDYVAVNKEMFDMLGKMDIAPEGKDTQEYMGMLDKIDNLRVFTTSEKKHRKELAQAVTDYLKKNPLDELMSVKSEGSVVKIYVNSDGNESSLIKEGLIFVEDVDDKGVVVVSFTGNLDLNDIKGLKGLKGEK